jgi:hypothetical protein
MIIPIDRMILFSINKKVKINKNKSDINIISVLKYIVKYILLYFN